MKIPLLFVIAFVVNASSNPLKESHVSKSKDAIDNKSRIYSSEHDIINLVFPLNDVNFEENITDDKNYDQLYSLFFTEVDIKDDGENDYKGLYVLQNKTAYKILENGRDTTACNDRKKNVFFAASDGIYLYNDQDKTAEKYGSLIDNFIDIVQENGTDDVILYAINDKYEMFKITEEGTKRRKVAGVPNAQQVVIDFDNNIYFYDQNKEVYVINKEGVKKFEGLKKNPEYIQLLNPVAVYKDYAALVIDDNPYFIYANGSIKLEINDKILRPTGYSIEAGVLEFFAYNKNIYMRNLVEIILDRIMKNILGE